jgi:hypothetical protein
MRHRHPVGQALVVFCLTMLLVTVLVCLTLSFSMRIREKMEAQTVADLSAYSSAVATARTFNSIAILRRAQTAHMVALTGVESLISWTTVTRANLAATRMAASGCPAAGDALEKLHEKHPEVQAEWHRLDALAGVQALNVQRLASHLRSLQKEMVGRLKKAAGGGPESFAQQLSAMASEGRRFPNELGAGGAGSPTEEGDEDSDGSSDCSSPGDHVSIKELNYATCNGSSYARDIAMASRGYEFITRRQNIPEYKGSKGLIGALQEVGAVLTVIDGGGSAYWGTELGHGGPADSGDFTWAEDHSLVEIAFPGCAPFRLQATAGVKSTDRYDTTDNHWWTPASPYLGKEDVGMEKQYRHSLKVCSPPKDCPNTFVGGVTYNTSDQTSDNRWAQPKLFGYVERDYKVRGLKSDPWNLMFKFRFTPESTGQFDNHGWYLADGTDISVQSALATGLAYYHRRGHWQEPPNLWNPFWRATLVSADSDIGGDLRRGGTDVPDTVGEPGAAAYRALIGAGYQGVH